MKQIRKNVLYNILLNISKVVFPLITAPYIARVLGPDGIGLVNFANAYAGYFAMIAFLGIPTYGVREIAKKRGKPAEVETFFSQMFTLSVGVTVLLSLFFFSSLFIFDKMRADILFFLIAGVSLYFAPLRIDWFYQGLEKFGFITARSLIVKTFSVAALFVFVRTRDDLLIYAIISSATMVGGDVWNYIELRRSGIRPRIVSSGLKDHFRPLLLLLLASMATSMYNLLDSVMLGAMREYDQVAYYSNASFISKALVAVVTSIAIVVVPRVAQSMRDGNMEKISDIVFKSSSSVIFFAVPMSVGIACIAPTFVPLFYGPEFYGSIVPLMIMGFLVIVIGLSNLTSFQVLIGMGFDRENLRIVGVGAACNLLLNLFSIPRWGAIGAAAASVFAELVVLVLSVEAVHRLTPLRLRFGRSLLDATGVSLLFIPLLFLLQKFLSGWWLVGVFIVAGFLLYMTAQIAIRNQTMQMLVSMVQSKIIQLRERR